MDDNTAILLATASVVVGVTIGVVVVYTIGQWFSYKTAKLTHQPSGPAMRKGAGPHMWEYSETDIITTEKPPKPTQLGDDEVHQ